MSSNPVIDSPAGFVPVEALGFGSSGSVVTPVDAGHPLPVAARGAGVVYADRSGTIAVGNTAQQIAPALPGRQGFFIQNLSGADLWLNSEGAALAGQPAIRIAPGQLYESPAHGVPTGAISILGSAAGQTFSAREW